MTWLRQNGWNILPFGFSLSSIAQPVTAVEALCVLSGKRTKLHNKYFGYYFYSLSYFIGATGFLLSKVLPARKNKLSNARARKNKYTARMLADARKDHSTPL